MSEGRDAEEFRSKGSCDISKTKLLEPNPLEDGTSSELALPRIF
jgi:hypothetical protein